MNHPGPAVQTLQQASDRDVAFDANTGCLHDQDTGAPVPQERYLSAALISDLAFLGSRAPLGAQIIATLFHAGKRSYSVSSLASTQGGKTDTYGSLFRALKTAGWVQSTTHRRGHAADWSLTPTAQTRCQALRPQSISGPFLLALRRLMPQARQDALVLRAHVLIRVAWSSYHVGRTVFQHGGSIVQTHSQLIERADEFDHGEPAAEHFCDCPTRLIEESLPGIDKRTVQRAVRELVVELGLFIRRRRGAGGVALTASAWELFNPPPATEPAPEEATVTGLIGDSYGSSRDSYGSLDPRLRNYVLDTKRASIGCAAQTDVHGAGDAAGDGQQADRTHDQPMAPLPPVAVPIEQEPPTPSSAAPLPPSPAAQTLTQAPVSPMHPASAPTPNPQAQTAPTDASEWQAIVSHHHRHSLNGEILKFTLWMAIPKPLRDHVTPDQVHDFLTAKMATA